jgi:osmotically-inducible protein OsmY
MLLGVIDKPPRITALAVAPALTVVPALQACARPLSSEPPRRSYRRADRRQLEVMFGDQRIESAAGGRVTSAQRQGHVVVTSFNYMVLLTGEVPSAEAKAQAGKVVVGVPQVKAVVNELQIAGASSAASRSNDAYITSKVKSSFLGNGVFRPTDVKVVTEAGVVYLLGLVTREEADAATHITRGTGGVQKVVRVFEYVSLPARKPIQTSE